MIVELLHHFDEMGGWCQFARLLGVLYLYPSSEQAKELLGILSGFSILGLIVDSGRAERAVAGDLERIGLGLHNTG